MRFSYFILLIVFFKFGSVGQSLNRSDDSLLYHLLRNQDPMIDEVLNHPDKYEFQLIYTKILEVGDSLQFEERSINKDSTYFYPASLIKFPLAVVAMELLYQLKNQGVQLSDKIRLNTCSCDGITEQYVRKSKVPTFEQFLREMMIMSNNDAYNLFFDLVGIDLCNIRMKEMGLDGIVLRNRFVMGCGTRMNRMYGGISFLNQQDSLKFLIPCDSAFTTISNNPAYPVQAGQYYLKGKNKLKGRKDYAASNFVRLADAHNLLIKLIYPDLINGYDIYFHFDSLYRKILLKSMGDFPRELLNAQQDFSKTPDHYYKFFLNPASMNTADTGLRIFNKVGLASGFISDVSYFEDKKNNVRYFISAAIFAKKDGIINGGKNNYHDFGIPVFRKIGALVYNYEIQQKSIKNHH